jgi:UDP-perosamine 4-acetyltransferase
MNTAVQQSKPCILIGGGGHGKVVLDLAVNLGHEVVGVCDPGLVNNGYQEWEGIPVLGGDEYLSSVQVGGIWLLNGIGFMPGSDLRRRIYETYAASGYVFPALVHPSATVSPRASLGKGVQVMAGAIVQAGTDIGANSIINTLSSVDHDCSVGKHSHVAPGATICGDVKVGGHSFIGAGAVVIQGIKIGPDCIVKAGCLVKTDFG